MCSQRFTFIGSTILCSVLYLHQPIGTGDQPRGFLLEALEKPAHLMGTEGPLLGARTLGRAGLAKPLDLASPG